MRYDDYIVAINICMMEKVIFNRIAEVKELLVNNNTIDYEK